MNLLKLLIPGRQTGFMVVVGMYMTALAGAMTGATAAYDDKPSPVPELRNTLSELDTDLRAAYIDQTMLPRVAEEALAEFTVNLADVVTAGSVWAAGYSYEFFVANKNEVPLTAATTAFEIGGAVPVLLVAGYVVRLMIRQKQRGAL